MDSKAVKLATDYEHFAAKGLPDNLEQYVLENYSLELSSHYGAHPIKNPFGKASGQLSLALHQVEKDALAGLGFCVLKTVIAEDAVGEQSMKAWAIPESHMLVEKITGRRDEVKGEEGWTVTWKGRGWHESFENYIRFFAGAIAVGMERNMLVVPSCKYHLPSPDEETWKNAEYQYTTQRLLDAWRQSGANDRYPAMPIEKDFSPTLAGSDLAQQKRKIREWLVHAPQLIRTAAGETPISIGVKCFNAMFEDDFQMEILRMLAQSHKDGDTDFIIYGNRLFDPDKIFEGHKGAAYGGPDLSARNLTTLKYFIRQAAEQNISLPPLCATGNIDSGARAIEYLKLGCSSFQMHTLFQLPDEWSAMKIGTKTQRALHLLLFHPQNGFIAGMLALREQLSLPNEWDVGQMAEYFRIELND